MSSTDKHFFSRRVALAGIGASFIIRPARAAAGEVVLANWGGVSVPAARTIFAPPFEKANPGVRVVVDASGPSMGKIRTMVESGHTTWDVCDGSAGTSIELGKRGLLERIDYSIVDKGKVIPEFVYEYGVGGYCYSNVLTFDTRKFPGEKPKDWADFWDLKKFPGQRALRRDVRSTLEAALMADGVPQDKVYPIDLPRALASIKRIARQTIFFNTPSEAATILRQGEASMAQLNISNLKALNEDSPDRFSFTWKGGVLAAAVWIVPKGNPAGREMAMRFIASMQEPQQQISLLRMQAGGPANPNASAALPAEFVRWDPLSNRGEQVFFDAEWYGENEAKALPQYLDAISS